MTMDTLDVRQMCLTCSTAHAPDVAPASSAFPRCEILSSLVQKISRPTWTSHTDVCQVERLHLECSLGWEGEMGKGNEIKGKEEKKHLDPPFQRFAVSKIR